MEPASGVELFIRAPDQSVKFSVYRVMMTHDDDDEVHIREKVTYELEKTVTLYIWKDESKRNKMKWNEESWMRGHQICPLTIDFNLWTVSSDVSIQRRHWQQLSVHLWAYRTHQPMMWMMCEGWPQHRGLRPLVFSNSGVGSFTSHKNQIGVSAVRLDRRFFVLIRED